MVDTIAVSEIHRPFSSSWQIGIESQDVSAYTASLDYEVDTIRYSVAQLGQMETLGWSEFQFPHIVMPLL
jgi:hypothetical protein